MEDRTEIHVVLDRSGSMQRITSDMEGGFDAFIGKQRAVPGECRVSLYQFDNKYEVVYEGMDLYEVPALKIRPRASTALNDAIGRTILAVRDAHKVMVDRPSHVVFLVITDGYENASVNFSQHQVKTMIRAAEKENDWQFVFLGADIDVQKDGGALGFASNKMRGVAGSAVMDFMSHQVSDAVGSYRSAKKGSDAYTRGLDLDAVEDSDETE